MDGFATPGPEPPGFGTLAVCTPEPPDPEEVGVVDPDFGARESVTVVCATVWTDTAVGWLVVVLTETVLPVRTE
jgi:hypothetical protein